MIKTGAGSLSIFVTRKAKAGGDMKRFSVLMVILLFSCGCAKLSHLQELLTLKSFSDNQDAQKRYVEKQDKKFDQLLAVVKAGRLNEFSDKKSFLKEFGEPIFTKKLDDGSEEWLYRYTAKLFGSEKVYLYFNNSGKLIDSKHVMPDSNKGNL